MTRILPIHIATIDFGHQRLSESPKPNIKPKKHNSELNFQDMLNMEINKLNQKERNY